MNVGGATRVMPFDGSKKGDWFMADIQGLAYTWVVMLIIGALLLKLVDVSTGTTLARSMSAIADFMKGWCGENWDYWVMVGMTFAPSFLLVFVLRRNIAVVHGPRRQFRYICRWL